MSWFNFGSSQASSSPAAGVNLKLGLREGGVHPSAHLQGGKAGAITPTTPTWDVNKDTDHLFQEHGVEAVKNIEKQTRLDIDQRRVDLRQMVGERYRDLIDAADSIADMQKCSEQVKVSVEAMDRICHKLQKTHFLKGSGGTQGPATRNVSHEAAAQLKLLAKAPEHVWVCLERCGYLEAAQHFLLARHIYSQLGLGAGMTPRGTVSIKVVQKMWELVAHFKEAILECCSQHLQCTELDEGPMVQSLCAIILLEGCTLRQAFNHFLLSRKAAVQAALHSGTQHRSVKNQILHLVKIILHSLLHIAAIFCQQQIPAGKTESSLLLQQLLQFKDPPQTKHPSSCSIANGCQLIPKELSPLLPQSVAEFRPVLRSSVLVEVPLSDIHNSTADWITMCSSDIVTGVEHLLQHVSSIKALASIKSAVHSLLSASPEPAPEGDSAGHSTHNTGDHTQWEERWVKVCTLILNKELNIWPSFFGPTLLKRVQFLLDKKLVAAGNHASSRLSDLLTSMISDHAHYNDNINCHAHFWDESSHLEAWQKGGCHSEAMVELSLKSRACTPIVYSFCQSLGSELESLLEDLAHYMQPSSTTSQTSHQAPAHLHTLTISPWHQMHGHALSFPFYLYADTADLHGHVQKSTVQWITRFLQRVDVKVSKLQNLMTEMDEGGDRGQTPQIIDSLLVIGRLCQCLLDCTQPLAHLLAGSRVCTATTHRMDSRSLLGVDVSQVSSQQWQQKNKLLEEGIASTTNLLHDKANSIFKLWSNWTATQLVDHLRSNLSADIHLTSLASTLAWSEIAIKEESESGQVSSVIHVPSYPSSYVTSLLFTLGQEIGRVGGHALYKSTLQHLSGTVMEGVIREHKKLLSDLDNEGVRMTQLCALQLFFNVRFLASILCLPVGKEEVLSQLIKGICETLQAFVDPFDLDVFMPFILANLESKLSHSLVMFGILLAVKGSLSSSASLYKPQVSRSGVQDKPVVLPLAPSMGRIPSLPLSTKSLSHHKIMRLQEPNLSAATASSMQQTISFFHYL